MTRHVPLTVLKNKVTLALILIFCGHILESQSRTTQQPGDVFNSNGTQNNIQTGDVFSSNGNQKTQYGGPITDPRSMEYGGDGPPIRRHGSAAKTHCRGRRAQARGEIDQWYNATLQGLRNLNQQAASYQRGLTDGLYQCYQEWISEDCWGNLKGLYWEHRCAAYENNAVAGLQQFVDPGPPVPIEIRFRVFIPAPAVSLTNFLGPDAHQIRCFILGFVSIKDCLFRGDGRGYSYDQGTHRFIDNIVLYRREVSEFPKFCTTHQYYPSGGYHPPGKPWWWFALKPNVRAAFSKQLQVDLDNHGLDIQYGQYGQYSSTVTIRLRGVNPLVNGPLIYGPPIDAQVTVTLYYQPGQQLTAVVSGTHDAFPAYEIYINGQLINGKGIPYDPATTFLASPYSLINTIFPQVSVSTGRIPIMSPYPAQMPPDPPSCN